MGSIISGNMGDILEVNIRDYSGAKIQTFRCNIGDKDEIKRIFKVLKDKYDIDVKGDGGFFSMDNDFFKV